jgi:hypothetical protein
VHVEYALSEADYFTSVAVSPEMGTANADNLAGYEGENQRQRSVQPPGVRSRRRAMHMPVTSRHHLTISSPIRDW